MVSLLKGKKAFLSFQKNGSKPPDTNLLLGNNVMDKKKKRKNKKNKGGTIPEVKSSVESQTDCIRGSDSPAKPKLTLKKKKVRCDKLLLSMMKKKKMKKDKLAAKFEKKRTEADSSLGSIGKDDDTGDDDDIGIVVEKVIPFKRQHQTNDKKPLLQYEENLATKTKQTNKTENKSQKVKTNGFFVSVPDLPVVECRDTLIDRFKENDTLIVVGETGSGKSTQIPQFLYKDCPKLFSYRGIAITQPRRVAAISLANRVACEMGTTTGEVVGYKVRFDKKVGDETKITFLTDGFLMMDAIRDKLFSQYNTIIVDEAHERSVETDVVLSLLRNAQALRSKRNPKKRLKLIIMSATLDVDKFKSFFDSDCGLTTKAVYVKGRTFNLQLNYLPKDVAENHIDLTWITLLKLHIELPISDHILVFLTGKEEIDLIVSRVTAINQRKDLAKVFVCPLYAALSTEAQMHAFELAPLNTRKIVVSTNLAETSLTIPGIRVVLDSGRVKSKYFEESLGMNVLRVQLITKSQADQRAGRAGRECDGSVYRLYRKNDYEKMEEFPLPEITRSNLSRVLLLAAVSLGVSNFKEFPLPDRPSSKAVKFALSELHRYGAIETNQPPVKLTRTAHRLLSFPVELHLAKVLYLAVQYQELSRTCAIVAMSTVESVYSPDIQEGELRRNKFQSLWAPEGDFITFWKIFKDYKRSKLKKPWCREHGIQYRTMVYVSQVWRHLLTVCQNMELEDNERLSCGDAIDFKDKIHLIFKTAFSHQIAKLSKTGAFYIVENQFDPSKRFRAKIHPSSSLVAIKPGRLIFTHLSLNEADETVYMHNCGVL